ncbi:MAG: hypothetical protein HQK83_20525 [Fibrobacteria bacterium]|nr:hypothetical protein [Fibrobacteria bacterium]
MEQTVKFIIPVVQLPLVFAITGPTDGQEYPEGSDVTVAGTVTEGAVVMVNGTNAPVSAGGWSAVLKNLPSGEQTITVEAVLGEETKSAEVNVILIEKVIELTLAVTGPADGVEIKTATIEVSGTSTPGASLKVKDVTVVADQSGAWTASLTAPSSPGEYTIPIEAAMGDQVLEKEISFVIPEEELTLAITAPSDGAEITQSVIMVSGTSTPGADIQVFEARIKADASGNWSASVGAPMDEGEYQLVAKASFGSQSLSEEVSIVRVIPKAPLKGSVNPLSATTERSELNLTGTCNDGAIIEAGNFTTTSRGGVWNMKVSWPESEEGTIRFEVYCNYNEEEALIGEVETEYTRPRVKLVLNLQTPLNITQKERELNVKGNVLGRDVNVEVDGKAVPLISDNFSYSVRFDEKNWDKTEIEVIVADEVEEISKTIEIEVDKTSPQINTQKPTFVVTPTVVNDEQIKYGIQDSDGDEVEVFLYVDGDEQESYTFEGSATGKVFSLVQGVHDYKIEAVDQAGNRVFWERRNIAYWPRVEWSIEVVNPRADKVIHLPPFNPDQDFVPKNDIKIRIRSLPDDDYRYLREVRIQNTANKVERIWRDIEIDDIEFEFEEMPLVRNMVNVITIQVEPKNGPIRRETRKFDLK